VKQKQLPTRHQNPPPRENPEARPEAKVVKTFQKPDKKMVRLAEPVAKAFGFRRAHEVKGLKVIPMHHFLLLGVPFEDINQGAVMALTLADARTFANALLKQADDLEVALRQRQAAIQEELAKRAELAKPVCECAGEPCCGEHETCKCDDAPPPATNDDCFLLDPT